MTEAKNDLEELDNEIEVFDDMEKNFHNVISELVSDHSLDKFRNEYEILHKALLESHENNKQLIDKCRQLNSDILSNASKISAVLELSKNDQRTIAGLRSEFEKAWSMVEISQERESRSKDVIESLKQEISNLSKLVEQGGAIAFSQETSLNEMSDQIVILKKEITMQTAQIENYKQQIEANSKGKEEAKESSTQLTEEIEQLTQDNIAAKKEGNDLSEESDKLHKEINDTKDLMRESQKNIEENSLKIQQKGITNSKLNSSYWSEVSNMKVTNEDKEVSIQRVHVKEKELEDKKRQGKKIISQINDVNDKIDQQGEQLVVQQNEFESVKEENEELQKAYEDMKKMLEEICDERAQARVDFVNKQREMYFLMNEANKTENNAKQIRGQTDKVVASTRLLKSQTSKEKQLMKTVEDQERNITGEVLAMKAHSQESQRKIAKIERETVNYQEKAIAFRGNVYQIQEEVKIREAALAERSTVLHKVNEQMKRHISLMEQTQNERDLASKQNENANRENAKIAGDLESLENEIESLKNDIKEGDAKCVETHYKRKLLEESLESLEVEVETLKREIKNADDESTQLRNRIQRSAYLLSQAEIDMNAQKHTASEIQYSVFSVDRGTVKRTNESEVLREKAKLLESTIKHSATAYKRKQDEIRQLDEELRKELHHNEFLLNKNRHGHALRLEKIRIEKSLLLEQGKARALEEDLEKPMNIHRWRILDGTNPEMAQLLRMQQDLRDKLMSKMSTIDRLKNTASELRSKSNIMEGHLEKAAQNSGRYQDEFRFYTEVLQQRNEQLKQLQEQMFQEREVATGQKEQVMTVRTMVREEKTNYYDAKKKVVKIRAKTAMGERGKSKLPPSSTKKQLTSSRREKQTKYIGGGFAVTNATMEHPTTRAIGFPLNSPNPGSQLQQIPSALSTSPRKHSREAHTALTKLPSGWNPRRQPVSPYLPVLSEGGNKL